MTHVTHIEKALPHLKGTIAEELAYVIHTRLMTETSTIIKATYAELLYLTEAIGTYVAENEDGMFAIFNGDNATVRVDVEC